MAPAQEYSYSFAGVHPLARSLGKMSADVGSSLESTPESENGSPQTAQQRRSYRQGAALSMEQSDLSQEGQDEDMVRLEGHLDTWCLDMKRSVLVRIKLELHASDIKRFAPPFPKRECPETGSQSMRISTTARGPFSP